MPVVKKRNQQTESRLLLESDEPVELPPAEVEDSAVRSEERRVGKECRSRCDWSSDVCSSDLYARRQKEKPADRVAAAPGVGRAGRAAAGGGRRLRGQIGRASCRERV